MHQRDSSAPPPSVEVLGVRIDALTRAEAAREVVSLVRSGGKSYVVKPYSEFLPRAARDERVREVLNGAAFCLPDGAGIVWAAHYLSLPGSRLRALWQLPLSLASLPLNPAALRRPIREPMSGVDFTWEMLSQLAEAGASVYLLGGRPGEADAAADRMQERLPSLRVAGRHSGYFKTSGDENDRVIAAINEAAPDVLLVGMGFPRQELWIAENLDRLQVKVAVAEGGSFTFISGRARRAPRWMRRAGLEWLFRLLREPGRIRRQLAIPLFVWLVARNRQAAIGDQ